MRRSTSLGWVGVEIYIKRLGQFADGLRQDRVGSVEIGPGNREHERIEGDLAIHLYGAGLAREQPARDAVEGEIDFAGVDAVVVGLSVEDID